MSSNDNTPPTAVLTASPAQPPAAPAQPPAAPAQPSVDEELERELQQCTLADTRSIATQCDQRQPTPSTSQPKRKPQQSAAKPKPRLNSRYRLDRRPGLLRTPIRGRRYNTPHHFSRANLPPQQHDLQPQYYSHQPQQPQFVLPPLTQDGSYIYIQNGPSTLAIPFYNYGPRFQGQPPQPPMRRGWPFD
uniref:Uncharacterized protein n=1 Tax=Lygus hesperus TaxID=30085 RepID=A0A0K8TJ30_LYGHE